MLRRAALRLSTSHRAVAYGAAPYSLPAYVELDAADVRSQLLDAALRHVKQHGWTSASLAAGARDLQLSPASTGMFNRGAGELVEHLIRQHNQQLAQELQSHHQEFSKLPVGRKIASAIRKRLEMNAQYMDTWPQALATVAQPANASAAAKLLFQLLDDIWYAAGDTSTDMNWYTKRALLAAVYTSTELYMLTDFSPGYQDTWEQLDRRIADALWIGSAVRNASAVPQQLLSALLQAVTGNDYASRYGTYSGSSTVSSSSSGSASASWSPPGAAATAPSEAAGRQLNLVTSPTGLFVSGTGI